MITTLTRVTDGGEPIGLEEIKAHLRVTFGQDDSLIAGYMQTARMYAERRTSVACLVSTWQLTLDCLPRRRSLVLPMYPVVSIVEAVYRNSAGAEAELVEGTDFVLDTHSRPGRIMLAPGRSWPTLGDYPSAVRIRFTAGHATAAAVPPQMIQAIRLLTAQWYENREPTITGTSVTEVPLAIDMLLDQVRIWSVGDWNT